MTAQIVIVGLVQLLSIAAWAVLYGLECFLNGGSGRSLFAMAWNDFCFAMPGGRRRKGNYIRKIIDRSTYNGELADGAMLSEKKSWSYQEIRDGNLYEEVGVAMLPGWRYFVIMHVLIPFGPPFLVWLTLFAVKS
jgi:hypothetical protein